MKNALLSIRPTDLRDFLKSQGWHHVTEALEDEIYVLNSPDAVSRQVVFPKDRNAPDYYDAIEVAFSKLIGTGKYDLDTLGRRIRNAKADVLSLRILTANDKLSLPFEDAVRTLSGIEKLLRSATAGVVQPRTFHPRLGFSESSKLLTEAQFEQTEPGSFIFNVSCGVFAFDDAPDLLVGPSDGSFVRKVFDNAYESAKQVVKSIERDEVDKLIDDSKNSTKPTVSANICEALGSVLDPEGKTTELIFSWSGLLPREATKPIKLLSEFHSSLAKLASSLKEERQAHPEVYVGTVERLDGEIGLDGRRHGNVILALLQSDEGETVRVRVFLSADDYAKADKAHMTNGAFIKLTGILMPGRQPRSLSDVRNFELLS